MNVLKRLFNFYLNSSIHVAFAAVALSWVTMIELHLKQDWSLLLFVFFATITGYNFVKYFGVVKFHHRSIASWLKSIQVFSFGAFLAMGYYLWHLQGTTLIWIAVLGVITFFYAIPIMVPKHYLYDDKKNLRQVSGLKVYLIAFIWMVTTVFLPLVNQEGEIHQDVLIMGAQRFCFILVLMFPFEIRDLNYDSLKLATIPQTIGIKKTKLFGVVLLLLFVLLNYFKTESHTYITMASLGIAIITIMFLWFSNKNQSRYYSAFWVESLPIFWLLLLFLLREFLL
ncbi:hypothetical protein [Winogradskyella rapida]|uniref:Prenyltransferase n=1 Tax=Winogradskyella rapida TaxID=549701 RepID=A0ABW3KRM4_9FLAO